jgi:hypothetical protein
VWLHQTVVTNRGVLPKALHSGQSAKPLLGNVFSYYNPSPTEFVEAYFLIKALNIIS